MTRFNPTRISLAVAAALSACTAFADDSQVLPQVNVHAAAEQGYAQQSTSTATKTDALLRDAGGVINRVTKQARYQPVREAVLSYGSDSQKRAAIDIGDAINPECRRAR
jgi:hypothetical protein